MPPILLHKKIFNRPLYAQVLFTVLAFLAMIILSYVFMYNIVQNNLVRNAESFFTFAQTQIEYDLMEPRTVLGSFAQTVRSMVLQGDDVDTLQSYIDDISDYVRARGVRISSVSDMFFYYETNKDGPVFLDGSGWKVPADYDATKRPWYQAALVARGDFAETLPYVEMSSGKQVISYTRAIFTNDGRYLGIACLDILFDNIGKNIVDIALDKGGYGILISSDFKVLAHANPEFVGKSVYDPEIPLSIYAKNMLAGLEVYDRPLKNWKGEDTVAFMRKLSNGWYLGLVTPKGPFYQSITRMALIISALGALFAAALILVLVRIEAAKNRADMESRHKSAFLANMSHEIRTPMNAIIGMTAIGEAAVDTERKDYCFRKIEDASKHLLGVINDILDMSKIEANKLELSPAEFNFEKMLQRVVNVMGFRVDQKQQKLSVYIDLAMPQNMVGDDQRLAQVITNLLGNAVKFTPEKGSIGLDTRLLGEENGVCTVQIAVTDTGIGISAEQQAKLFRSFQQAEASTTRKFGGTGLGLAISKNIVEMMGGKIWIQSEPGKGSTFSFTVQMKRGTDKPQEFLPGSVNWDTVRILAVDDDPDVLTYFREIIRGFGLSCDIALSGQDALKLIEQNGAYHIYFVDWKMPGMDGIQLANELKLQTSEKCIVIMISAVEWNTIAERAKKAGVDKFLSKPLFPSVIADVIKDSLGMERKTPEKEQANIAGIFAGRCILLAEDVEINREIVLALLEPTLLKIDCAGNGVEAVKKFSEAPDKYDMIFMDLQMPEMDGYEATRHIRALEAERKAKSQEIPGNAFRAVPIVAMTANVFKEDIEGCLEAGMNSHVGKPLDMNEILDKMRFYMLQT